MLVSSLILAGGRARRMGEDKRFLTVSGSTLLQRSARAAQEAFQEVWILLSQAADRDPISQHLGRQVRYRIDSSPRSGPLGALSDALPHVSSDHAFLLAVDYPFVTASLLRRLVAEWNPIGSARVLVPLWEGCPQVACALYSKTLSGDLARAFRAGERSLTDWLQGRNDVQYIAEETWEKWAHRQVFFNLNTPDQVQKLLDMRFLQPSS